MRIFYLVLLIAFSQNLNAQMDSVSYSAGLIIGKNLKAQGFTELDAQSFMDALNDVYSDKEVKISLADANKNFKEHIEMAKSKADLANKTAGEEFLTANAKKEGIMITASGLQYEVVVNNAEGTKPTLSDEVRVHYHGTTIDGTVFDSSVDRGESISFPLNGVIKGWQEGLQLMTVGSKYRFYIPQELAYGGRAAGPKIKPYSALIFDVELLGIE